MSIVSVCFKSVSVRCFTISAVLLFLFCRVFPKWLKSPLLWPVLLQLDPLLLLRSPQSLLLQLPLLRKDQMPHPWTCSLRYSGGLLWIETFSWIWYVVNDAVVLGAWCYAFQSKCLYGEFSEYVSCLQCQARYVSFVSTNHVVGILNMNWNDLFSFAGLTRCRWGWWWIRSTGFSAKQPPGSLRNHHLVGFCEFTFIKYCLSCEDCMCHER